MKRIFTFLLVFILLLTSIPISSVFAADFRWIDIEVISKDNSFNNSEEGDYSYKDGIYSFKYFIKTDFQYNKNATTVLATFSQAQLGDRVTRKTDFSGRKMRVYVNISDFSKNSPDLLIHDFQFTDTTPENYDTTITLLEYVDFIENRRIFYVKDINDNYFYAAFSTRTDIAAPSMYSTDSYLVKLGSSEPYKGKYLYIITELEKTTIDRDNEELYKPETNTYSGELTSFFMKDEVKNTISYIFTESSQQKQYVVLFDLNKKSEEYFDITSDTTIEDFEEQIIDEYQEGRKLIISGYIEGSTDYKEIIIVDDFSYLDDSFTRYDKENVFINATVTKNISTEIGRDIYEIKEQDTNLIYYAIFDKNVLGNAMPKNRIDGRNISIHGITEYKNGKYYIGVLSFGLENSETSLTDTYNIKEISLTSLLSETNDEVAYKGIDTNGKVGNYLFSKNALQTNMPTSSLLNKTLNIAYVSNTQANTEEEITINTVLAWTEIIRENQDYAEKGQLLERLQDNDTSSVYNFKNSYGEILQAILPKEIEKNLLQQKGLTKKTDTLQNVNVSLFGNISTYETQRRFVVKDANLVSELYINKTTADVFTFNGTIDSIVSQTTNGITYHAKNSYNQYALLYFSKDTLTANYPKTSLLNKNLVIRGLTYSNGIILVTDYNEVTKMNTYPSKIEPLYVEPEHYTNMEGLTGVVSMLKTESGKTHLTLITSSARYLLSYKPAMKDTLESYIGNMVYLRGEPHSVGNPIWSMSIDVYDIAPVCFTKGNCDTFIKPINTPGPAYQDDGQKTAIHTEQDNGLLPENYEYGKAILESLFLPKFVNSQEKEFFNK